MDLLDPPRLPPPEPPPRRRERATPRRAPGRRSRARARSRRQRRQARVRRIAAALARLLVGAIATALVAALVLTATRWWAERPRPVGDDVAAPAAAPQPAIPDRTVLLVRQDSIGGPAAGVTLLSTTADGAAAVVFLPASTLLEIPGIGLDRLAHAQRYGGLALTVAAVENALGIAVDDAVAVSPRGLRRLLEGIGGASLVVPDRLIDRADDGTATVAFEAGEQYLPAARLAEYWAYVGAAESELDTFPRQQAVWSALLRGVAGRQSEPLADLARLPAGVNGAMTAQELASLIDAMASAAAAEDLTFHLLPVTPLGTAEDTLDTSYRLDGPEVSALVATVLAHAVPQGGGADAVPIQVLNGVGRPGVGQLVDAALEGLGFRIALTDNARSFDFTETQIVIYDESPASRQAAAQVRSALGVGRILVSRQPQSVVTVTVVVGFDFVSRSDRVSAPGI